jgi:CubicO group peptidase (beta-lactamase class C family)
LRKSLVCLLGIAFALVASGAARAQSPEVAARIERVEAGLLPATVAADQLGLGRKIAERMRFHKVPGISVAVINDGKVDWAKGYGVVEMGGSKPVTPATLFQAGSVSKSVAAMGALYLVEHGMLDLDEDVNKRLVSWKVPENAYTKEQKVTLRRLLSHTAGLTVHGYSAPGAGRR